MINLNSKQNPEDIMAEVMPKYADHLVEDLTNTDLKFNTIWDMFRFLQDEEVTKYMREVVKTTLDQSVAKYISYAANTDVEVPKHFYQVLRRTELDSTTASARLSEGEISKYLDHTFVNAVVENTEIKGYNKGRSFDEYEECIQHIDDRVYDVIVGKLDADYVSMFRSIAEDIYATIFELDENFDTDKKFFKRIERVLDDTKYDLLPHAFLRFHYHDSDDPYIIKLGFTDRVGISGYREIALPVDKVDGAIRADYAEMLDLYNALDDELFKALCDKEYLSKGPAEAGDIKVSVDTSNKEGMKTIARVTALHYVAVVVIRDFILNTNQGDLNRFNKVLYKFPLVR